ncbi:MAG: hypothetical protein LBD17_03960 [Endomicrobium sp.]|jgi:hypothetical protein|nr:hypothetical protein [Endomicrobium sp.]
MINDNNIFEEEYIVRFKDRKVLNVFYEISKDSTNIKIHQNKKWKKNPIYLFCEDNNINLNLITCLKEKTDT